MPHALLAHDVPKEDDNEMVHRLVDTTGLRYAVAVGKALVDRVDGGVRQVCRCSVPCQEPPRWEGRIALASSYIGLDGLLSVYLRRL
jgi:hypothetical protein